MICLSKISRSDVLQQSEALSEAEAESVSLGLVKQVRKAALISALRVTCMSHSGEE